MKTYPYQRPTQLHEDLWEVTGSWSNKLGRRMTVLRLPDGQLVVHNAFQLHEPELDWLRSLGPVAHIVAPNAFHCSDAGWMAERFPEARVYAPPGKVPGASAAFPALPGLVAIPMNGTRLQETAFVHPSSRTLVLTDLAFNMPAVFSGVEKWLMTWNKVGDRFGPSRLTRLVFTKNRAELLASYKTLLEHDFDRVIVNHGDVLPANGKTLLARGVKEIFPDFT